MIRTIYSALYEKLGREPTNAELKAEVDRIKTEALIETASRGKLSHQKRRRTRGRPSSITADDILRGAGVKKR